MADLPAYVLDAFAFMAYLQGEPAAHLKANHTISYADAFVGIAAQKINGIIMTGDPEFEEVTELVQIDWLKKRS